MPDNFPTPEKFYLFIGTYNPKEEESIFVYQFDTNTGKASFIRAVSDISNPSFLTLSPDHTHIYAVSETGHNKDGHVFAYHFNKQDHTLDFVNKAPCEGNNPCNIISDKTGKWLFVSNYSSGSLTVMPVKADGSLGPSAQLIRHQGHSINPDRQAEAHVHCAVMASDNQHLFVTDLGMDKLFGYLFDQGNGSLAPANPAFTTAIPGSGPRLMEFSPDGRFLYVIHELGGQITVFEHQSGSLTAVQVISNLPDHYTGKIWSADVHLSTDGKFLYATNRDDLNDIVTYKIEGKTGKITPIDRQLTGGKTPRNFTISPDGKYVLIGHRNSGEITIFKRNKTTGLLTLTEERIPVAHAVCLKMI